VEISSFNQGQTEASKSGSKRLQDLATETKRTDMIVSRYKRKQRREATIRIASFHLKVFASFPLKIYKHNKRGKLCPE